MLGENKFDLKKIFFNQLLQLIAVLIIGFFLGSLITEHRLKNQKIFSANDEKESNLTYDQVIKQLLLIEKNDHVRGNSQAKITLIEYSDFNCSYCQEFHLIIKQLLEKYPDKVKWVYRHYPLQKVHSDSIMIDSTAECVAKIGGEEAFWNFTDKLYEKMKNNSQSKSFDNLLIIAEDLNLNSNNIKECVETRRFDTLIKEKADLASRAGINVTPYSFISNDSQEVKILPGTIDLDNLSNLIEKMLQQ